MSQAMALEVAFFKLNDGVSDEEMLNSSRKVQDWLQSQPGYVSRQLSKGEEGQWIDIVQWRNLSDAKRAADAFMSYPDAVDFATLFQPESVKMMHFEPQLVFEQ